MSTLQRLGVPLLGSLQIYSVPLHLLDKHLQTRTGILHFWRTFHGVFTGLSQPHSESSKNYGPSAAVLLVGLARSISL